VRRRVFAEGQAVLRGLIIDGAFDLEDCNDVADGFYRQR
jgi:hypothetical protein